MLKLILRPKVNPNFSCPQSVLYLPIVLKGIEDGEIEVVCEELESEGE